MAETGKAWRRKTRKPEGDKTPKAKASLYGAKEPKKDEAGVEAVMDHGSKKRKKLYG